jgi:hypothetical protein
MRGLLIASLILLSSCSAQRLMQRAIKKDPSILSNDTIIFTIPDIAFDTVVVVEHDTLKIESDIDSIIASLNLPDTCKEIVKPIVKYVTTYRYLTDTIRINKRIVNDSMDIKIGGNVYATPDSVYVEIFLREASVNQSVETVTVNGDTSFFNKAMEIALLAIILLLIILFIRRL